MCVLNDIYQWSPPGFLSHLLRYQMCWLWGYGMNFPFVKKFSLHEPSWLFILTDALILRSRNGLFWPLKIFVTWALWPAKEEFVSLTSQRVLMKSQLMRRLLFIMLFTIFVFLFLIKFILSYIIFKFYRHQILLCYFIILTVYK